MKVASKRREDRAAHDLRQHRRDQEMQAEKRGEDRHGAREDAARDLFGRAGQAAQAVLDVLERARPAAAGPKRLARSSSSNSLVSPLEDHRQPFLPPFAAPCPHDACSHQ
jgi:hypothetical protein